MNKENLSAQHNQKDNTHINNDSILMKKYANLFKGFEAVGGKVFLTEKVIRFQPHLFNIQSASVEIQVSDIIHISKCNTLFLIPNGVKILTQFNSYHFVMCERQSFINTVAKLIQK